MQVPPSPIKVKTNGHTVPNFQTEFHKTEIIETTTTTTIIENENNHPNILIEKHGGLLNKTVFAILTVWYILSALTLFTNKHILTNYKGDPTFLGAFQMLVTSLCGCVQINFHKLKCKNLFRKSRTVSTSAQDKSQLMRTFCKHFHFWRNMLVVGLLRFVSIILCLMALKYSSISFVETIKSSSPLFIVILSRILIGEITGFWTKMTLIPIMAGLALCSSFEVNFSTFGFIAAILTNLIEW
jgi:solute carrier family 35 protein E2